MSRRASRRRCEDRPQGPSSRKRRTEHERAGEAVRAQWMPVGGAVDGKCDGLGLGKVLSAGDLSAAVPSAGLLSA